MKKYFIALGSNLETQNLSRLEIINFALGNSCTIKSINYSPTYISSREKELLNKLLLLM